MTEKELEDVKKSRNWTLRIRDISCRYLFFINMRIYIYYKQLVLIHALFYALSMRFHAFIKAKALTLRASELHPQSTVDKLI